MNENEKKVVIGETGIYDARKLGIPKMIILGIQHTFAMFGATVLVPLITGLDVSTALLMAGLGTLLFHLQGGSGRLGQLASLYHLLHGVNQVLQHICDALQNRALLLRFHAGILLKPVHELLYAFFRRE